MLTAEQIETLRKFCQEKGVPYYDLQMELVDHLATGIEEKMMSNANLDFKTALKQVYNAFGDPGFVKIIGERHATIEKAAKKLELRLFKEYFTYPKITVSILLFVLIYALLHASGIKPSSLYISYCLLLLMSAPVYFIFLNARFRSPAKALLSLSAVRLSLWRLFVLLPNTFYFLGIQILKIDLLAKQFNLFLSLCILSLLLFFFAKYNVYKAIYNNMKNDYPLAFEN